MIKKIIRYAREDFWDFLSWIAFAIGVIYVFLKVRGILHSPVISDIIGIGSVAYFLGKKSQKLDAVEEDLHELKADFRAHCMKKAHWSILPYPHRLQISWGYCFHPVHFVD